MRNTIIKYMTYQQLKYLVQNKSELSLEQYENIVHSIRSSPVLEIALANYPIKNLSNLLAKARNQYQTRQNQTQKQAINVHDAVFAARRAKTKKWLKDHQPRKLVFNDDEGYKKQLLGILANNKDWLNNLSAKDREGPNYEENGIVADFPEYIEAIFKEYSKGSTRKDTLFWLLENISKLEGKSKQDAEIYLLTTLNMSRLAYDSPGNVCRGKRYSCMLGLDDRLIDMVFTYIPEETKIVQEAFIETYYRIAVKSTLHLLPKMFIYAHDAIFKSDMQYQDSYNACDGITHDEKRVIKPLKNKVCEMFGINNFYLEHLLSVSDDNELYGMFAHIEAEHTEEKQKQIEKNRTAKALQEKINALRALQNNRYFSEKLEDKHMTYFVWGEGINDKLALNIKNNIGSYIDGSLDGYIYLDGDGYHIQKKYLPCQEELIITLINRDLFKVEVLKKLFLASLKAGFSNLAEIILNKLVAQNEQLDYTESLNYAVKYKSYEILQKLLDMKIPIINGACPLSYAAINNDEDTINLLIQAGAKVDAKDSHDNTALMRASQYNSDVGISILIDKGASAEAINRNGNTALMVATQHNCIKAVKMLIEKYVAVNQRAGGGTALTKALYENSRVGLDVIRALVDAGADTNATDDYGNTALVRAVKYHSIDVLKVLLTGNTNINARGLQEDIALIEAVKRNKIDAIRILIEAGANIDAKGLEENTALIKAAMCNNIVVIRILIEKGANTNVTNRDGYTALTQAAFFGKVEAIKVLLDLGVDINVKDRHGRTAWFAALTNLRFRCFMVIIWYKINLFFNKTSYNSATAAVNSNQLPAEKQLLTESRESTSNNSSIFQISNKKD